MYTSSTFNCQLIIIETLALFYSLKYKPMHIYFITSCLYVINVILEPYFKICIEREDNMDLEDISSNSGTQFVDAQKCDFSP